MIDGSLDWIVQLIDDASAFDSTAVSVAVAGNCGCGRFNSLRCKKLAVELMLRNGCGVITGSPGGMFSSPGCGPVGQPPIHAPSHNIGKSHNLRFIFVPPCVSPSDAGPDRAPLAGGPACCADAHGLPARAPQRLACHPLWATDARHVPRNPPSAGPPPTPAAHATTQR